MTVRAKPKSKIFLSYGYEDRDFAARLSNLLGESGVLTFDPQNDLKTGDNWQNALRKALKSADKIVFIVPSREGSGKSALIELGAAKALGKAIVAVIPDSSRAWNSSFARTISDHAIVDASRMSEESLVNTLALAS